MCFSCHYCTSDWRLTNKAVAHIIAECMTCLTSSGKGFIALFITDTVQQLVFSSSACISVQGSSELALTPICKTFEHAPCLSTLSVLVPPSQA